MSGQPSANNLFDRICAVLEPQFLDKVRNQAYDRLVIFAGNGLTRIAAALGEGGDVSWTNWIKKCLEDVKSDQGLEYLLSLGYSLDQVFSYALDLAATKERSLNQVDMWRYLWGATLPLKPSPLHQALMESANVILTTNYDGLFELTARNAGIRIQSIDMFKRTPDSLEAGKDLYVFKLHGSFPQKVKDEATNGLLLEEWGKGVPRAAASTEVYEELAIQLPASEFEKHFDNVISELAGESCLVLFLGTGLGAEELIITRILLAARARASGEGRTATNWLALETSEPLDPLYKFKRRGIKTIRLPLGLVASSETRALAALALLKIAVAQSEYSAEDKNKNRKESLINLIDDCKGRIPESPSTAGVRLADSSPRIVSIGQSAVNRVAGFEQSISEEKAYGACKASWSPIAPAEKRLLTTTEVGGQALVPCLVWDALGIPCAFMSHVLDDDLGRIVLRALQGTKWVDFSGVTQVANGPEKKSSDVMSTENATAATWFGIRTILDLFPQSELHCSDKPLSYDAQVLYVTKRGWENVRKVLDARRAGGDRYDPLIVFETGGRGGAFPAESWVAQRKGIVLASAESALGWFGAAEEGAPVATDGHWEERAKVAREKWKGWSDTSGAMVKDDRGRVFQNAKVLKTLRDVPRPDFLCDKNGLLNGLILYGITLGDLGIIFWTKSEGGDWLGPRWCFSAELSIPRKGGPRALDDAEMRNGLGCGDVSRAGFCAALLLDDLDCDSRPSVSMALADAAVAWAHWFGTSKIRFFSLTEYVDWLRGQQQALPLVEDIRRQVKKTFAPRQEFTLGAGVFEMSIRLEPAVESGSLHPDLEKAFNQLEVWKSDGGRDLWDQRIREWRSARGIE
jgi:sugar/nucleoside kinase (ribokinase family)